MIVKNEAHVIEKTLDMLVKHINFSYWVISDTGSSDNTKEIIINFFKKKDILGELVEHKWVDFGYNRTKALESAYNKTDYIFIFDADDWIHGNLILPSLTADMYLLKFGSSFVYKRPLLVNNKLKWKFVGVLHEYIASEEKKTEQDINGDYYIESGKSGSRSQDPNKYTKDAKILENAYETEPDYGLRCRYAFYCAQSYMDANDLEKSIIWYKKVLDGHNWNQEKYYACLMASKQSFTLKRTEDAISFLTKATEFDNQRIEHVARLLEYYHNNGSHLLVNLIYEKYKNYEHDSTKLNNKLFLSASDYEYKLEHYNSISAFYVNNFVSGYESCKKIINSKNAPRNLLETAMSNVHFYNNCIENDTAENIKEFFVSFNDNLHHGLDINKYVATWDALYKKINFASYNNSIILNIKNRPAPQILLSMTTCKRYELFEQTINSLLNQCTDIELVDHWFLVDDNSSPDDIEKMKTKYPFFDFYLKRPEEKGHRASMNIIFNKLNELRPTFWLHLEDDFLFYDKMEYIKTSMKGIELLKDDNVKQILFNSCYAETVNDYNVKSFIDKHNGFYLQDHQINKKFNYVNNHYWPYYSFRPSLVDVSAILKLGNFDSENQFFEMDYANKWRDAGYKSGFFNKITNRHIGRLTSERNNKQTLNAYDLNNENQFIKKTPFIKIVNLERRVDRRDKTKKLLNECGFDFFEFVKAIDGKNITNDTEDLELFIGNDFGSRRGFIGCALSHYNLWKQLLNDQEHDYYLILEDDFEVCSNFKAKIEKNIEEIKSKPIIFFGYSMFKKERDNVKDIYDIESDEITIKKLNRNLYIGGTFCYSINKKGAKYMIDYIEINGIKHGFDYVIGKLNAEICYESQPLLVFSEWNENGKQIDSDIQHSYDSIVINENIESDLRDQFVFVAMKDQIDNDLYFHRGSIRENMRKALKDPQCEGFNTLGFFKKKISVLTNSKYFTNKDGIYIKKNLKSEHETTLTNVSMLKNCESNDDLKKLSNELRVKMLCDWQSSHDLCKEFLVMNNNNSKWKNMQMVSDDNAIDYYVIINKPAPDQYYNPAKTLVFQMEPWVNDPTKNWGVKTWGEWSEPDENKFLYVGSHKKYLNNVQWQISIPEIIPEKRLNKIITIISEKNFDEGHKKRIDFINFVERKTEGDKLINVYGRENYHKFKSYSGKLKQDKKENHYINYKYCFAVENNYEDNYASEKIWEPILCEMLCFYWGCPNLEKYVNSKAFVRLDMNDFNGSLAIIKKAIKEDLWNQRINVIREEKQKILNELGFFPRLNNLITDHRKNNEV